MSSYKQTRVRQFVFAFYYEDHEAKLCIVKSIYEKRKSTAAPIRLVVIGAKFIAFWFDAGRALTTKWQRRNDEIILRSSLTGSSYVTSSEKIGWISTAHTADGTREETYSINRKTLVANRKNLRRIQEFTCEILLGEKQYKLKLVATRDALQDQYNARLEANQF